MNGYLRADGRKGIRNIVAVAYLVECSRHVAHEIAAAFRGGPVHVIGFPGCYPNPYALRMMKQLCTHPNVGAVLLVSLGCEGFDRHGLMQAVRASGRPVETGRHPGDRRHAQHDPRGRRLGRGGAGDARRHAARRDDGCRPDRRHHLRRLGRDQRPDRQPRHGHRLRPAGGRRRARRIFEETGELIGLDHLMADRAVTPDLGRGDPRLHAQDRGLLPHPRAWQLRRRQRRWRPHHDRGEVARRLCEKRPVGDCRPAETRRCAAARAASICST